MSKHFLYPDWWWCQIQQGSRADVGAPCSTSQVVVLTWFKKSLHSHWTRQEELQQTPAGYHYCPESTDGVKAEKSSRSFSSWHWLLVYWVNCRTPWDSTDEDWARAGVQQALLGILPSLSSTSNTKGGKKHLWSRRSRQEKKSWNNADLSDLERMISCTIFFYHFTEQQ